MGDFGKLILNIQATNPDGNENELKNLKTLLSKQEELIGRNVHQVDDALNALDPNRYCLAWLYFLYAKSCAPRFDPQRFISQARVFLENSNPQHIRLAPSRFARIGRRFTELLVELRQPIRGIVPLRSALVALSSEPKHITPLHTDFVQLCLLSKCYRAAIPVLDEEAFEVSTEITGLMPRDLLAYFYYGGRVYVGMKQYKKALEFFRLAFTAPAVALSAIMAEAYKKYVLVALIVYGQIPASPKYTSSVITRHIKNATTPYAELATAYATHNIEEVSKIFAKHLDVYQKDGNLGLARQVLRALSNTNIKRYTQTYLTLSLDDIAKSTGLGSVPEVESTLLRMIEDNEIFASINQKDGMVAFKEDPEHYNTNTMMKNIDAQIEHTIGIEKRLRGLDELISLTPAYIQRASGGHHDRHRWGSGELDEGFHDFPMDKGYKNM